MTSSAPDEPSTSVLAPPGGEPEGLVGTIEVFGRDVRRVVGDAPTLPHGHGPEDRWVVVLRMPDGRLAVHHEGLPAGGRRSWLVELRTGDTIDVTYGASGLEGPVGAPRRSTPSMTFDQARWEAMRADAVVVRARYGVDPLDLRASVVAKRVALARYVFAVTGLASLVVMVCSVIGLARRLGTPSSLLDGWAPWTFGGAVVVLAVFFTAMAHPPRVVRRTAEHELAWAELARRTWWGSTATDTRDRVDFVRRSHRPDPGAFPPATPGS